MASCGLCLASAFRLRPEHLPGERAGSPRRLAALCAQVGSERLPGGQRPGQGESVTRELASALSRIAGFDAGREHSCGPEAAPPSGCGEIPLLGHPSWQL